MPRNGSGTYTRPQSDYVPGTTILATSVNSDLNDMAQALTASIARDGQTTPTGNLPMGNFRHTGVADGTARTDYAALGQTQNGAFLWGNTAGGTANAATISLNPPLAAYAAGQAFRFQTGAADNTSAVTLNVNSLGAVAVNKGDGTAALAAGDLPASAMVTVVHDGTRFRLIDPATNDALVQAWVDLASATTTDLGTVGANVRITGTTTITGFGTAASGTTRKLRFAAALTLTHNATSLILPGAADITTAAGDTAEVISLSAGNWVLVDFTRAAAGYAGNILLANPVAAANIGINRGTEQATSAGTQVQYDFGSIPAGVRRVKLLLKQVSTNGTSHLAVRLGTSGGIVSSGYDCMFSYDAPGVGGVTSVGTGAFGISNGSIVDTHTGIMTFENQSGNLWLCSYIGMLAVNADRYRTHCAGFVDLGAVLTQLRLTTNSGTPVFDAGFIQLKWEF
jgi:hypothetical protein